MDGVSCNYSKQLFYRKFCVNSHWRPAAIDMYFSRSTLNCKIGNVPGEDYMGGACSVLYLDVFIHEGYFIFFKFGWIIKYNNQ